MSADISEPTSAIANTSRRPAVTPLTRAEKFRIGVDILGVIGSMGQLYLTYKRNKSDHRYQNAQFDLQLTQLQASERALQEQSERLEKDDFFKESQGFSARQKELLQHGRYAESIDAATRAIRLLTLAKTTDTGLMLQADTTQSLLTQYLTLKGKALYLLGSLDAAISTFAEIPPGVLCQEAERWSLYARFDQHCEKNPEPRLAPGASTAELIASCRNYCEKFPEDDEIAGILQFLQAHDSTVVRLFTLQLNEGKALSTPRLWEIYARSLVHIASAPSPAGAGTGAGMAAGGDESSASSTPPSQYLSQAILSYTAAFNPAQPVMSQLHLFLLRANAYRLLINSLDIERKESVSCSTPFQSGLPLDPTEEESPGRPGRHADHGGASASSPVFIYSRTDLQKKMLEDVLTVYERDPRSIGIRSFCTTHALPYPPKILRDAPEPDTIDHFHRAIAALNGDKERLDLAKANREFLLALTDKKQELITQRDAGTHPHLAGQTDAQLEFSALESIAQAGHLDSQFKLAMAYRNGLPGQALQNRDREISAWRSLVQARRQIHTEIYKKATAYFAQALIARGGEGDREEALPYLQSNAADSLVMRFYLAKYFYTSPVVSEKSKAKAHFEEVLSVSAESPEKPEILGSICSRKQKLKAAYYLALIYKDESAPMSQQKARSWLKFVTDRGYEGKPGQPNASVLLKKMTEEEQQRRGTQEPSSCSIS